MVFFDVIEMINDDDRFCPFSIKDSRSATLAHVELAVRLSAYIFLSCGSADVDAAHRWEGFRLQGTRSFVIYLPIIIISTYRYS